MIILALLFALITFLLPTLAATFPLPPTTCPSNPLGPLANPVLPVCPAVLVDNLTDSPDGRFHPWSVHPWTYRPFCAYPPTSQPDAAKVCVFSRASLAGGPGVSLVTHPHLAAALAHLLDGVDPLWSPAGRPPRAAVADPAPFLVGPGRGVVATRRIAKGTVLLRETPALVEMASWYGGPDDREFMLERAFWGLSAEEKRVVVGLARVAGKEGGWSGVMNVHGFGIDVDGVQHVGLFPGIARIHHSCRANTYVIYTRSTLEMEVVASHEIEPGTEITVNYIPACLHTRARHAIIESWGITCACTLCSMPADQLAISDANRLLIHSLLYDLADPWTRDDGAIAVIRVAEEAIALLEKEEFSPLAAEVYSQLAQVMLEMDELDRAEKFGKMATEMVGKFAGRDTWKMDDAVAFLERVEKMNMKKEKEIEE